MTGAISSGLPNLAASGVAAAPAFPAALPTKPLSPIAFRINEPWGDGIYADVAGSELFRQRLCNRINGALGCGVET